ncbi:MAG: alkaline phosphatase family protein [Nitriliruptorales bacterium]
MRRALDLLRGGRLGAAMAQPLLYVVLDGLGDDPVPDLGDRTPLEAAETPHLDRLAGEGALGLCTTVGEGVAPESDVAVMSLLGFDPAIDHPGRGPVEALGAGMEFHDGDVAWRCNFATVDDYPNLVDRRAGRDLTLEEAEELAREVNEQIELPAATFELQATVGHRAALVIRTRHSPLRPVTNTDPAYRREGSIGHALAKFDMRIEEARVVEGEEDDEGAVRAAELTNLLSRRIHEVLDASPVNTRRREEGRLPANALLFRDAGSRVPAHLEPIGKRFARSFGCFVEMPVEAGISRMVGMSEVEVPGAGDDPAEQYGQWAQQARESIRRFDALYVHIKGPDIPAHDGDAEAKRDVIAAIDAAFFGELGGVVDDVTLLVTADHATSSVRAAHTDDPVPYLVRGPVEADDTREFSEPAAREGSLPHLQGPELLPWVLDLT